MTVLSPFERFKLKVVGTMPAASTCWLFHKWQPWVLGKQTTVLRGGEHVGYAIFQHRTCSRCNKVDIEMNRKTI